jgi:hypothetical protein
MAESPSLKFKDNLDEVFQLLAMHAALAGEGPGRKHSVEILNKSAILFICASFEAFIEDLSGRSFEHLVLKSKDHTTLPKAILKSIAEALRADKNEIKVWDLAGEGWRTVAEHHKQNLIKKHIGSFNTPKPHNIETLLKELTGIPETSHIWKWQGMNVTASKQKLKDFVELRGSLAHGIKPATPVLKKDVIDYIKYLAKLSVRLSNEMCFYCKKHTGEEPWDWAQIGAVY